MSWFPEQKQISQSWIHRFCTRVLKAGPIPKHVAIIMDGNRRFAQKNSINRAEGHLKGFNKLAQTLEWCLELGIMEVTVYAFSIENFKRSKEEVDGLMELAREKFARFLQEKDLIQKHQVRVKVLGNLKLLPLDLQKIVAEAVMFSKDNKRATLNVCLSYTSRDEISTAMHDVIESVTEGQLQQSDISEELLDKCMYTNHSNDLDLLIRTSGEVRLSDFLLWQSDYTCLSFVNVLWPEFSIWHMYAAILHFQRNYNKTQEEKKEQNFRAQQLVQDSDYQCVLSEMEEHGSNLDTSMATKVQQYATKREKRIEQFVNNLNSKRLKYFEDLLSNS